LAFLPKTTFAPLLMTTAGSRVVNWNKLPQKAQRTRFEVTSSKSVEPHWVHL
jgi:hypothetical protein